MKLTAEDYTVVDDGEYPARFTSYERRTTDYGEAVILTFDLLDDENQGLTLSGLASLKLTPKAKLRSWVEGILGRPLESNEEIDLDDLIGRQVMLYVSTQDTERGLFNRIEKIRPVKKKTIKRAFKEPVEEQHDEAQEEDETVPF